jgi:MYXO-CTERM domain-containing protein
MNKHLRLILATLASTAVLACSLTARGQSITYGPILGRGATPDQMIIKWGTDSSTGPSSLAYRTKGAGAFQPALGSETQNSSKSFDHQTVLNGLSVDTAYEYQVTAGSTVQPNGFTTCPSAGAPMDVVFYGDSRDYPLSTTAKTEHTKIAQQVLMKSPDLVFDTGDLVYNGAYSDYLSLFFPAVADLVATVPFMAVPGNHDNGDPFDLNSGGVSVLTTSFGLVFPTPQPDQTTWTPYYSFVCGNAMFIGLNSESLVANAAGDTAQMSFLMNQLATARAQSNLDHVFVWFHHSPYSPASGPLTHGDNATVQSQWVPLFDDPQNKVTAVVTGHDHIYARMNDGSHVAYVISGGAGAGASTAGVSGTSKAQTAAAKAAFGFVAVHIAGATATGTAFDDTGTAIDTWTSQSTNPNPGGSGGSGGGGGGDVGMGSGSGAGTDGHQNNTAAQTSGCEVGAGSNVHPGWMLLALVVLASAALRRRRAGTF